MAFGGAGLYCWVQTILSYKMASIPQSDSKCRLMRVFLSTIQTTCFITSIIYNLFREFVCWSVLAFKCVHVCMCVFEVYESINSIFLIFETLKCGEQNLTTFAK